MQGAVVHIVKCANWIPFGAKETQRSTRRVHLTLTCGCSTFTPQDQSQSKLEKYVIWTSGTEDAMQLAWFTFLFGLHYVLM